MIKAVLFDVDGVLLDSLDANVEYYQELFKAAGYPVPSKEALRAMHHMTVWDVIKRVTGVDDEQEVQRIWNLSQSLEYEAKERMKLPQGAHEVVQQLSARYPLAVVTSRTKAYAFEDPLDTLKKQFKFAIAYEDTAEHKPHPEPLLLAAKELGVRPEECVYIGDSISDIAAAKAAKMKVIFYSPTPMEGADAVTDEFARIPELVERLAAAGE